MNRRSDYHGLILLNLAGGVLPSEAFGANAAWWWIMILAFNLNSLMKALRFHLLNL